VAVVMASTSRTARGPVPSGNLLAWARARILDCLDRIGVGRDLAELSDHALRDIGLSRDVVRRETPKWFWQA
jgi:hypothetical protein